MSSVKLVSVVKHGAGFVKSSTRHIAAGCPKVTPEEKSRRLGLCQTCEHFEPIAVKCRECGCKLKIKASWQLEHCPIDKW